MNKKRKLSLGSLPTFSSLNINMIEYTCSFLLSSSKDKLTDFKIFIKLIKFYFGSF